jgi:hypothetical protein
LGAFRTEFSASPVNGKNSFSYMGLAVGQGTAATLCR